MFCKNTIDFFIFHGRMLLYHIEKLGGTYQWHILSLLTASPAALALAIALFPASPPVTIITLSMPIPASTAALAQAPALPALSFPRSNLLSKQKPVVSPQAFVLSGGIL